MTLRVTFVGSGDAFGSGGRLQACIMLDDGHERVLLDCGTTSLVGMKRLGIEPNTIETVIVSHLHADHFGGIPFLVLDGQFSRRARALTVAGPVGTRDRVLATMEALYPSSSGVQRRFETVFQELSPAAPIRLGATQATAFLADHASGAPAHITRVEFGGRVIAYSGDTAWTPALVEASRGADLFICESYMHERRVPFHLSYAELLDHRDQLDCRRVVLTHMTGEMIAAEGILFERAEDGLVLDV